MSYSNGSQPADWPADGATAREPRDALRQALDTLGAGGTVNPESLAELARAAGLTNAGRVADVSRMLGMDASGRAVPQHIFFLLGDDECALPPGTVQAVERLADITHVPNTVPWVLGVVQVWGSILSVVDLRRYVGLTPQPITSRSRLLVASHQGMTIGFAVDAVTEMRPLGELVVGAVDATTPQWALPFAQGRIHVEGHAVTLLDPERLLLSEQMHRYRADAG